MGDLKIENKKFGNIIDMQSDEDAERDGVDISFGNGRSITIRRSGSSNRKYKTSMGKLFAPHQKPGGSISMDDETAIDLLKQVYAESVVVGWEGFTDEDGKEVLYSKRNCIIMFDEAPEIFDIIQNEAAKFSNFARREIEDSGK